MDANEKEPAPPGWFARQRQKLVEFLTRRGEKWATFRRWCRILQPARACLLASLLVPLLFAGVDQGRDTLRLVASRGHWGHVLWMFAGMWTAGLASWGWARFLLYCKFCDAENPDHFPGGDLENLEKSRRVLRRICGLLPPVGMAVGFIFAAANSETASRCFVLAGCSLVVAALLWILFEQWRRHEDRMMKRHGGNARQTYRFKNIRDVTSNTFALWSIRTAFTASVLIFVGMTFRPVPFGEELGSPAVILFAITAWISLGSMLIYAADRFRLPLLTALFLWAIFCSMFNDNHDVRTLPADPNAGSPPKFNAAFDAWYHNVTNNYPKLPPGQKRPVYLVASAGGGIRAAYWTAIVLSGLEDCARSNGTSFAANTFVLSGVSGGSLGEVTFVSLLAHRPDNGTNFTGNAPKVLNKDFLAADLAKMAYADLLQRFLPFPVSGFDRARSLEDAWAAAWTDEFHTNVLDESISQLYADATNAGVSLPHLLLNGTCVESGQRIITSDLAIRSRVKADGRAGSSGNFLDALVASDKLSNAPIRLSTAAHQSARFTYFSPAGRFPDGTHIVDGGYFENSGASTLMDALKAMQWRLDTNHWDNVELRIILINNDPILLPANLTNGFMQSVKQLPGKALARMMRETLSPVRALLNTRTARGNYAVEQALEYNWTGKNIYQFNLYQRPPGQPLGECAEPAELPLGWTLSTCAMNEMNAQLTLPFNHPTNSAASSGSELIYNQAVFSNIVATLPRPDNVMQP